MPQIWVRGFERGLERPSSMAIAASSRRSVCRVRPALPMTERNEETSALQPIFPADAEGDFSAGQFSSDGGALPPREVDRKINLLVGPSASFVHATSPLRSGTSDRRCWRSASSVWRWPTRISAIISSWLPSVAGISQRQEGAGRAAGGKSRRTGAPVAAAVATEVQTTL